MSTRWIGAIVTVFLASSAFGATPKNFFPEAARTIAGGRSTLVVVSQAELRSDIAQSNMAMAAGGGLLFALVDAGVNSSRAKAAEAAIQPLRGALTGFDFDALAKDTTAAIVADVSWLDSHDLKTSKDGSRVGLLAALDSTPTDQLVTVEYTYGVAPDFASMSVTANVTVALKSAPAGVKPANRRDAKNLVFSQRFTAQTTLAHPSKVKAENVAKWDADNAQLARSTLTAELADIRLLAVRGLNESEADSTNLTKSRKKTEALEGGVLSTDGTNLTLARTAVE